MTEADWRICTEPVQMLKFVSGDVSLRKLRLVACGCCRRIAGFMDSQPDRQGLLLTERDVDGQASEEEFAELGEEIWDIRWYRRDAFDALNRALTSYMDSMWDSPQRSLYSVEERFRDVDVGLADLVRDIIGNPFRAIAVNPAWLPWNDGTVTRM